MDRLSNALLCARSSTDRASDYGSEGSGFESLRAHKAVLTNLNLQVHNLIGYKLRMSSFKNNFGISSKKMLNLNSSISNNVTKIDISKILQLNCLEII